MGMAARGLCLACAAALWLAPATASADRLTDQPDIEPEVKLSVRIKTQLTELSGELDKHLSALSFDLIGLRFDAHQNRAKVRVDAGDDQDLSLHVDSDVHFRGGAARVKAKVDLGLAGRRFSFELPEFDMVPRTWGDKRYVELRLPLIEGTF